MRASQLASCLLTSASMACGGSDAVTPTDGGAPDTATDAPLAADAIPKNTFCQTRPMVPFFCQDFDEGDLSIAFRQGSAVTIPVPNSAGGGSASIAATAKTPPGAYRAAISVGDAGQPFVRFEHPASIVSPGNGKVGVAFDFRIAALSDASEIASLYQRDANQKVVTYVELAAYPMGGMINLIAGVQVNGMNGLASKVMRPTEEWTHVDLSLDGSGAMAIVTLSIDNGTPVQGSVAGPAALPAQADFDIGASPLAIPASMIDVAFDEIVFGPR